MLTLKPSSVALGHRDRVRRKRISFSLENVEKRRLKIASGESLINLSKPDKHRRSVKMKQHLDKKRTSRLSAEPASRMIVDEVMVTEEDLTHHDWYWHYKQLPKPMQAIFMR